MPKTANGSMPIDAETLRTIDPTSDDFQHFYDFGFYDDSEEHFGVFSDIYPGDIWVVKFNVGYVSDAFQDWGVILQTDGNETLFQGIHDSDGLSEVFVWDGDTLLGSGSAPGNVDLLVQQVVTSDSGVNYSAHVTAYRVKKDPRALQDDEPPFRSGTQEVFDS